MYIITKGIFQLSLNIIWYINVKKFRYNDALAISTIDL